GGYINACNVKLLVAVTKMVHTQDKIELPKKEQDEQDKRKRKSHTYVETVKTELHQETKQELDQR
ncbi:14304_t:CDS:2, partial [Gigaspora rosea]